MHAARNTSGTAYAVFRVFRIISSIRAASPARPDPTPVYYVLGLATLDYLYATGRAGAPPAGGYGTDVLYEYGTRTVYQAADEVNVEHREFRAFSSVCRHHELRTD